MNLINSVAVSCSSFCARVGGAIANHSLKHIPKWLGHGFRPAHIFFKQYLLAVRCVCVRAIVVNNRRRRDGKKIDSNDAYRKDFLVCIFRHPCNDNDNDSKKNQWNHQSLCLGKCDTRQSYNPLNLCTMMHAANSVFHLTYTRLDFFFASIRGCFSFTSQWYVKFYEMMLFF